MWVNSTPPTAVKGPGSHQPTSLATATALKSAESSVSWSVTKSYQSLPPRESDQPTRTPTSARGRPNRKSPGVAGVTGRGPVCATANDGRGQQDHRDGNTRTTLEWFRIKKALSKAWTNHGRHITAENRADSRQILASLTSKPVDSPSSDYTLSQ